MSDCMKTAHPYPNVGIASAPDLLQAREIANSRARATLSSDGQRLERFFDAFLDKEGRFTFRPDEEEALAKDAFATRVPLVWLAMDGMRIRDEWPRVSAAFPNPSARIEPTGAMPPPRLSLAAQAVLALADDFDRAIDARPQELAENGWAEGIAAIDRKLRSLLESEGVTEIDATPGRHFDPREHDAIANVPGTGRPEGEIVDEVRRGYRLRDRVLRPALVAVAAPTTESEEATQPEPRIN